MCEKDIHIESGKLGGGLRVAGAVYGAKLDQELTGIGQHTAQVRPKLGPSSANFGPVGSSTACGHTAARSRGEL